MKILKYIPGLAVAAAMICIAPAQAAQPARVPAGKLPGDMRKLWHDHVALTRAYLLEAVANKPSANATLQRLMHNQVEIGDAFKPAHRPAQGAHRSCRENHRERQEGAASSVPSFATSSTEATARQLRVHSGNIFYLL